MPRDDIPPVKVRIKSMSETMPHVAPSACGNTRENMTRAGAKDIPLISQAQVLKGRSFMRDRRRVAVPHSSHLASPE
jgi:hypothetical protein